MGSQLPLPPEFLDGPKVGEYMEARGDVLRAAGDQLCLFAGSSPLMDALA